MEHDLAYFRLKEEVEEFLYEEADLLDQRRYGEWLDLLADDLHYFMPMRRNVAFGPTPSTRIPAPGGISAGSTRTSGRCRSGSIKS